MPGGKPVIFHTIAALCEDGKNKKIPIGFMYGIFNYIYHKINQM